MSTPIDFIVRQGLQVQTNVVVGSYTLNVATPPTNGLIVSGNVGVGTASPVQKLQVVGNIQITNNASSLSGIYFADGTYQATSAASYSTPSGGPANSVQYNNGLGGFGGSSNFVFSSNFVGIGTSNPAHILDVQSSSSIASFATKTGTDYQIFVGNNTPAGNAAVIGYNNTSEYAYIGTASGVANSNVYILANGNVGIGVSNPASKMDVNGGLSVGSYAGSQSAPTNGLIVSGSVGIGITNPTAKLSIVAGAGQTGLIVSANATAGVFEQFQDSNSNTKFQVDATGNISIGGWTGNVIAANYGGTGQSSFTTGDILYAGSTGSIAALTKLGIGSTGTVLQVNSGIPSWGQVNLASNNVTGILPLANGGTNASSFSSQAIVYTANSTTMTGLVSSVNAAVVFSNTGAPSAVSGGPYTYLSPGAGGGNLSFSKVDLANGVTNTLGAGNGGTGQNTIGQYQLLVGGATNNWNLLSSSATSALVTSVTGSPQWTTGAANTVLRSNGTTITFSQVVLTSDVSGILPYANGGTNANTSWTQGSLIFAGSSSFAQNNAQLYWDNTNNRLGLGTTTPTTTLDVNGAATIRNGANVVAGGMFVQAGVGNFVSSVIANDLTGNTSIYTPRLSVSTSANVGGLTSNSTVLVNGTEQSTSYTNGALVVQGGAGIGQDLNVGGNLSTNGSMVISGNLTVLGNVISIASTEYVFAGPIIEIGAGNNEVAYDGNQDRGVEFHYFDNIGNNNTFGFFGMQKSSQSFIYVANASYPSGQGDADIFYGQPGNAYFGNITIGSAGANNQAYPLPSTSTTSGALVIGGSGGIGLGGSINAGGNGYFTTGLNTGGTAVVNYLVSNGGISGSTISGSGQLTVASVVSNSFINGTSIASSGPLSAADAITGASVVSNSFINGTSIASSGPLSAADAITGATVTSNGFIFGSSLNTSGTATVNTLVSNGAVQGASVYSSGPISAVGTITAANLVSNAGIQTVDFYATGPINGASTATFANITSNGYIQGSSVYSSGPISAVGAITGATITSNSFIFGSSINSSGAAIAASITSNSYVQGASVYSSGPISAVGTITAANLVSNAGIQTVDFYATGPINGASTATFANIQSNGYVQGASFYSSGPISAVGTITAANFTSNGFVFASTINSSGSATVNSLVSNSFVQGASVYSSGPISAVGTITAANLVSNAGIQTVDFYATGPINGASTATFANIQSNGYVQGASLYASGTINATGSLTAANMTSNGFVFASSLNTSGTITTNNLTSNGYVQGASIYSSGPISAVGTLTSAAIVSNTSVTGNSFVMNGNLATISTTGTVTVDTFPTSTYRTVHYLAQITDNTNVGQFHSEQLMILQDGTTAYQTEFNLVFSVQPLGAFSSSISGGVFSLFFTPYAATNKSIRVVRTGVDI